MIAILTVTPDQSPQETLRDYLKGIPGSDTHCCALRFQFRPYWTSEKTEEIGLVAVYQCCGQEIQSLLISDQPDQLLQSIADKESPCLSQLSRELQTPLFNLQCPMFLQTCAIPKPWGQEIWYTGVEERGVCGIGDGEFAIPIPWLLSVHSEQVSGGADTLVLLKILDPLPDPTFGDLYFEMHEKKQEVYVVTHVDNGAWPDGVGAIRFGFNQQHVVAAGSKRAFLEQYQQAVANYRIVRSQIDALCDQARIAEGIGLNDPVDAATMQRWLAALPATLVAEEQALREAMYAFTALRELRVGDVVSVPNFVPHSLQHGVRTVEFQTPVYERKILSFAQKVLTQSEWDTEAALSRVQVEAPKDNEIAVIARFDGAVLEKIVDFDDFHAFRLRFEFDSAVDIEQLGDYSLVMSVIGSIGVCGYQLGEQQAAIIPSLINTLSVVGKAGDCLLLCAPKSG